MQDTKKVSQQLTFLRYNNVIMEWEGSEKMKNTDELTHEIQMVDDIVSYFENKQLKI